MTPFAGDAYIDSFDLLATVDGRTLINENVTKHDGMVWSTENEYFWPREEVQFYAIGNGMKEKLENLEQKDGLISFGYTVPKGSGALEGCDAAAQPDLVVAAPAYTYGTAGVPNGCAPLQFSHPLAGLIVKLDKSMLPTEKEPAHVEWVRISGLYGKGTCVYDQTVASSMLQIRSSWSTSGSADASYTQKYDTDGMPVNVRINGEDTESDILPFMLIPQALPDGARITIHMSDNSERSASLSEAFYEWEPGKIYTVTLSKLEAKYPPVENLNGSVGNNTVTLTWQSPLFDAASYPEVKPVGVTITVVQTDTKPDSNGNVFPTTTVTKTIHYPGADEGVGNAWNGTDNLWYNGVNDPAYPLFAEVEGLDTDKYNEFQVKVTADYVNTGDHTKTLWKSVEKSIMLKMTQGSNAEVAFYVPEGADWDGNKDHVVTALLDDDDKAAAAWFMENFPRGKFVQAKDMLEYEKAGKYTFRTIWFPCGVSLTGGEVNQDFLNQANEALGNPSDNMYKISTDLRALYPGLPDSDFYDPVDYDNNYTQNEGKFARIKGCRNLYNDDYRVKEFDRGRDYVTPNDKDRLRNFYHQGKGNLLLTTFALCLCQDLGIRNNPNTVMFNEVKQPSIWFVANTWDGDDKPARHPIYKGLFTCTAETFPEYIYDHHDNNPGNGFKHWDTPCIVVGRRGNATMVPLLSRDSKVCENNNVIWDKDGFDGYVLGTWGQMNNADIQGISLVYGNNDHGRALLIGLGAYEFNNGMKYDPESSVLNKYQSNVQKLTLNALNYLNIANPTDDGGRNW